MTLVLRCCTAASPTPFAVFTPHAALARRIGAMFEQRRLTDAGMAAHGDLARPTPRPRSPL
jgi:hypothetical protein